MILTRPFISLLTVILSLHSLFAQENDPEIRLARQLDSIAGTNATSRHFAELYTETVLLSMQYYQEAGAGDLAFVRRFEQAFAGFFLRADSSKGLGAGSIAWRTYFNDSTYSPLQYRLLGINAHINADLSEALIRTFTLAEIQSHKKSFLRFQQALRKQYTRFYEAYVATTELTRLLDQITLGLARTWGNRMMARWRKRQYRIALLHFTNPVKAARLVQKTTRRKERTDRLILRHL